MQIGIVGLPFSGKSTLFQTITKTHIDAAALAKAMNALEIYGVKFRPIYFKPYYMPRKGVPLQGVQMHLTDPVRAELTSIQFLFLQEAHKLDPSFNPFEGKENRYRMFDMVSGSDRLRISMMEYFDFDADKTEQNVKFLNESANVFKVSSRTGEGLNSFVKYIEEKVKNKG